MPIKQYVEKPFKVRAEQFDPATMTPPPSDTFTPGLCACTHVPGLEDGRPHVHAAAGIVVLQATDWIVQEQWSPYAWSVIPDAEFTDRFGGGGGPNVDAPTPT